MSFLKKTVNYLGYKIDAEGLHTCEDKIRAIKEAPVPQTVKQLQSFLGLVNYYHKFLPNSSSVLKPLYNLLRSEAKYVWSTECDNAFIKIKKMLSSAPVLAHYDPDLPIRLTVDASDVGVGAIISHTYPNGSERPIAFASRTLSEAQKNYSQLEKEALAIIFGLNKFHQYLYGRKFTMATDNRPLVTIFGPKKGIPILSANRLQRWAWILSNYDYDITYVSSKSNSADSLSRLPLPELLMEPKSDYTYFNYVADNEDLPLNSKMIADETTKDPELSQVLRFILKGWPSQVSKNLQIYKMHQTELTCENNCILFGYRVLIPSTLRATVLRQLHMVHMGIVKTKSLARSYVWWPGMDKQIENICKSCENCLIMKSSPIKAKLIPWEIPSKVWERIHCDFLGPIFGKHIFIVVDAYSKWVEAFFMNSTTAGETIKVLRSLFARFGIPEVVVSDNGAQFMSSEFQNFLTKNGVKFKSSPPFHPASNGRQKIL